MKQKNDVVLQDVTNKAKMEGVPTHEMETLAVPGQREREEMLNLAQKEDEEERRQRVEQEQRRQRDRFAERERKRKKRRRKKLPKPSFPKPPPLGFLALLTWSVWTRWTVLLRPRSSSSTAVARAMLVFLVVMLLVLCSFWSSPGLRCSASVRYRPEGKSASLVRSSSTLAVACARLVLLIFLTRAVFPVVADRPNCLSFWSVWTRKSVAVGSGRTRRRIARILPLPEKAPYSPSGL